MEDKDHRPCDAIQTTSNIPKIPNGLERNLIKQKTNLLANTRNTKTRERTSPHLTLRAYFSLQLNHLYQRLRKLKKEEKKNKNNI